MPDRRRRSRRHRGCAGRRPRRRARHPGGRAAGDWAARCCPTPGDHRRQARHRVGRRSAAELSAMPDVTLLPRTVCLRLLRPQHAQPDGAGDGPSQSDLARGAAQPRQRLWRVRAKDVILATGAIERPMVYLDNDRPGCMLASAAQTYVNRYGSCARQARRRSHQQRHSLPGRARSGRCRRLGRRHRRRAREPGAGELVAPAQVARHRDPRQPRRHPRQGQAGGQRRRSAAPDLPTARASPATAGASPAIWC